MSLSSRVREPGDLAIFAFCLVALTLIYLPTLLYPYLLTDELWIVRPNTYSWTFRMGRFLFSAITWLSGEVFKEIGFNIIYVMRGSGICALAATAYFLVRWLEIWGHSRWTSVNLTICILTLPAYQIVVADGTQLSYGILLSTLAVHFIYGTYGGKLSIRLALAAVLLVCALLIYQQQMLIAFSMLAMPLLQQRHDQQTYRFVFGAGAFLTFIPIIYFLVWKLIYRMEWIGNVDQRYGPDAVGIPDLAQLQGYLNVRIPQITSLWDVIGVPKFGWLAVAVTGLMVLKVLTDFKSSPRLSLVNYAALASLLVLCDGFALLANNYPAYVTAPALSLLIFYWSFCGLAVMLGRAEVIGASALAVIGGLMAFITVKDQIAVPSWRQFQAIRDAIENNPENNYFHILGTVTSGPGYQEFGRRNSTSDNYLYLVAIDVSDDLLIKGKISKERRRSLYISISHTKVRRSPKAVPYEPNPSSIVVKLEP